MRFILLLTLLATTVAVQAQSSKNNFHIKGDLSRVRLPVLSVYFSYTVDGVTFKESAQVKNDSYEFEGRLEMPVMGFFEARYRDTTVKSDYRRDYFTAYLEKGTIYISSMDSFSKREVKGSKSHEVYMQLQEEDRRWYARNEPFFKQVSKQIQEAEAAGRKEEVKQLKQKAEALDLERRQTVYGQFIKQNPASPMSLYALNAFIGYNINPEEVEPLFNLLHSNLKNSAEGQDVQFRLQGTKRMKVGAMATDFTQNDSLGRAISLSSFKGQYVLVDFWASWCKPCREENPNVVQAFNQYKDKNFTVLGVALERPGARSAWLNAINKDSLTWTQVTDFKFFNNDAARLYGINAIPRNLLVDPQGKIIAINLRGKELLARLKEIMGN